MSSVTEAAPPTSGGVPPRSRGARSTRKRRAIIGASLCGFAIVAIVVLAVVLSENVVYFRTVSEAVHARKSDGTKRFRMAGKVVPGTIHQTSNGVRFEVTDGKLTAEVDHTGDPPSLFKPNAPVVCEGHWAKGANATFDSDRILIRHGNDYEPPKVKTPAEKSTAAKKSTAEGVAHGIGEGPSA